MRERAFAYYETIAGGMGASAPSDGASATHTHMTNSWNTPVEAFEHLYPLRIRSYRIRSGSGGAGKHRGGDGIVREYEFLTRADVTILSDRRERGPYGLFGRQAGRARQRTRCCAASAPSLSPAKRALKCRLATCCASNRPAEAATASPLDMRQTWRRLTFLHWPYPLPI